MKPELEKAEKLQSVLDKSIDKSKVFGTSFCIKYNEEIWRGSAGNIQNETQYFIASTTKLFVTAVILKLRLKGILNLDDKISKYLDDNLMRGLHVLKNVEYSADIRVCNLLAHTSGLPDYFQDKDSAGKSLEEKLKSGEDKYWTPKEAIMLSKSMTPLFKPDTKGKAHYSDTNFQLLGLIIERITGRSVEENFDEMIIRPLKLTNTYLYNQITDNRPVNFYYQKRELNIPKAMTSFKSDGGIVSNSSDMLVFIEAFFTGALFPKEYIKELEVWNRIFFPMQSGTGIHLFKLPWVFNPFGTIPDLIGHSGLSGALAYSCPEKNLYIAGTVNQVAYPDTSFKITIKLIQTILKK
ncbi:MAG: beta-lactamase family protein [Bacteroidetes bacterium]|nr:beta-lactamase family protein [Bacteroidota bacterium]